MAWEWRPSAYYGTSLRTAGHNVNFSETGRISSIRSSMWEDDGEMPDSHHQCLHA